MEIPVSTEVETLSENEVENHHREEFPEKRVNIQTSTQVKQKNPEEFKNGSSVIGHVDEIEIVKKGPDLVSSSLNKILKPRGHSSKPLKVYFRPKTWPVNKLRLNMKSVLDPKFKKDLVIIRVRCSSSDHEEG